VAPLFEIRLFLLRVATPRSCEKIARRGRTEEWWRVADGAGADRFARVLPLIG
jgi:hypothetical protein